MENEFTLSASLNKARTYAQHNQTLGVSHSHPLSSKVDSRKTPSPPSWLTHLRRVPQIAAQTAGMRPQRHDSGQEHGPVAGASFSCAVGRLARFSRAVPLGGACHHPPPGWQAYRGAQKVGSASNRRALLSQTVREVAYRACQAVGSGIQCKHSDS